MNAMTEQWKELAVQGALVAAILGAHFLNAGPLIMGFLSIFAMLTQGYALGPRLLRNPSALLGTAWGFLATLGMLMLTRGALFYAGMLLDGPGEALALAITLIAGGVWLSICRGQKTAGQKIHEPLDKEKSILSVLAISLSVFAAALIGWAAFRSGTTNAIRTPWPLLPSWVLPLIALQWTFALASAWRIRRTVISAVQIGCAMASTALLAPLLYRIGYGFDGFLHVAGERVLLATGTLLPKPPYYMGQYVFVTWLSKLMDFDVASVDTWLVPAAAAVLIPAALALVIGRERQKAAMLPALILMPLSAFVATTPHGFASVLGIAALLLCIRTEERMNSRSLPLIFALWALLTHPLVGLPVLVCVFMAIVSESALAKPWRIAASAMLAITAGFSVPLVFGAATAFGSGAGVSFHLSELTKPEIWSGLMASWVPWVGNRYALWAETSVWAEKLLPWITILFAGLGTWRATKSSRNTAVSNPPWFLAAGAAVLAAVVLKGAGDFSFLIDYEKGNYADRLFLVAWFLLLPAAVPELGRWLCKARMARLASRWAVLASVGILAAGMSYASLPRHDAVTPSRGWSVGYADIEAVRLIHEDSEGRPYTVLANQSVSAAAVRTFGFLRYHDDVFMYPIPTGGELYKLFLRASYEGPEREVMSLAGALGGSRLVYFVVNDYWWKANELSEAAEASANRSFLIRDGAIRVFRYDLDIPAQSDTSAVK